MTDWNLTFLVLEVQVQGEDDNEEDVWEEEKVEWWEQEGEGEI